MLRLYNHDSTKRIESGLYAIFYLRSKALLHLQTTSKDIHNTRDLAESRYIFIGDVTNMSFAKERQHMMLTHGKEVNIFYNYHLPIFLTEHGRAQYLLGVFSVSFSKESERLCYPFGCFNQTFSVGIFADQLKDTTLKIFHLSHLFGRELRVECRLSVH